MKGRTTVLTGGLVALLLGATISAGCNPVRKLTYRPDQMRSLIRERVPDIKPEEIVVPWEVRPQDVERTRRLLIMKPSPTEQANALADALSSPLGFNLRYAPHATTEATATLDNGEGNCFALASVFVGLSRAIGLKAHYMDFSGRIRELRDDGEVLVNAGHITGVITLGRYRLALDVGGRLGWFPIHRFIDDLEAVAHYYNNRGYDLIHKATQLGKPIPWSRARRSFMIATRIRPDFVRAWNNLGVAYARLGRTSLARQSYQEALRLDPEFASAFTNLGLLALARGNLPAAIRLAERAIQADSDNPYPHYLLGLARYRYGQIDQAIQALEQALDLNKHHGRARKLLARIYTRLGWLARADRVMPAPTLSVVNPPGKKHRSLKPFVR